MKETHLSLKNPEIHYYISGENNKDLLIFLHPAFANHHTFDDQVSFFSENYKTITIDLIGHGHSICKKTKDGIDCSSEHVREIINAHGHNKVHLVGVSIGSLIAQDFANKYPEMVLSLCVVGGFDINNYDASLAKEQNKQQLSFVLKALFSIKSFCKANCQITAHTKHAQDKFYEMNCTFKRRSFRYLSTLNNIMNQYKTNKRMYPLLISYGEFDHDLAISLAQKWHFEEPNSQLHIFKNAGHCANMDNPKEFNEIYLSFIRSINHFNVK